MTQNNSRDAKSQRYRGDGRCSRLWWCWGLLFFCWPLSTAAQQNVSVERHRMTLKGERAQVVLFDLTGNGEQEVLVVEADRAQRKPKFRLRVFVRGQSGYAPLAGATVDLPFDLVALSMGRFSAGPALVVLTPQHLHLWPWQKGRFRLEQGVRHPQQSVYRQPGGMFNKAEQGRGFVEPGGALESSLRWVTDLNGDGRDEIIVPLLDGFEVLTVQKKWRIRRHAHLLTLGSSQLLPRWLDLIVLYRLPMAQVLDLDGRGWQDLVSYSDGLLQLFFLDGQPRSAARHPDREFDLQPPTPFDPTLPKKPALKLIKAQDVNKDGLLDLVLSQISSVSGSLNKNTRVLVYYGRSAGPQGFEFSQKPEQVFDVPGFAHPVLVNLNGDDRPDLVLIQAKVGVWNIVKALTTGSIGVETAIYYMPPQGKYAAEPDEEVGYSINFSLGREGHRPLVASGDFNGDGQLDLLLSSDKEHIGLHWGSAKRGWKEESDVQIKNYLPTRMQGMQISDLNADGRDDIVLSYDRTDIRLMPAVNRSMVILLSRFRGKHRFSDSDESAF